MNLDKTLDVVLKENNTIRTHLVAKDWKEAIRLAVEPLVTAKIATADYADMIISETERLGPYYIVADLVAMPHAKHGSYNLQNGFSLITLKEPVLFGDQPVRVLICLSSITSDFHVASALPQICALFEDPEMGFELANAKDADAIFDIIKDVDFSKYLS